jgi:hypothetical protein
MMAMTCEQATVALLEAELDELRGNGESGLAGHLRTCARCRLRAEAILTGYASLDAALMEMNAARTGTRVSRRGRQRRTWRWLPLPLAAAAALALLMLRPNDRALPNVDALARIMFRAQPRVQPPAGRQAVIIERNDMTIVWLYNQEKL